MRKKKRISKKEKLERQREAKRLIAFSQMSYEEQLRNSELLVEIA